jgi:transposase
LRNEQILFLFDLVGSNCGIGLNNQALVRIFGITPHHPLELDESQEKSFLQFVQDGFTSGKYVTQREIMSFVEEHFQETVTYGWLASFLERWDGIVI